MTLLIVGFLAWLTALGAAWWAVGRSLRDPTPDKSRSNKVVLWTGLIAGGLFVGIPGSGMAQDASPTERTYDAQAPERLTASTADTLREVDLGEALQLFASNNLSLRRIRAESREAEAEIRSARSYPNPRLGVTHEPLRRQSQSLSETYVNLSQRLTWSGRSSRIEAARRHADATRLRGRADSARLALEVATTYLTAAADERRLAHLIHVARVFRQADSSFAARQRAGEASGYAARRVGLERARYEEYLAATTVARDDARRRLAGLILPEDVVTVTAEALPDALPPRVSIDEAVRTALRERLELRRWNEEIRAQRASTRAAGREGWPAPTVTAGYKRQSDGFEGAFLGVSVPIPVFDRNRGQAQAEAARLSAAQVRQQRVRREIQNEVRHAVTAYQSTRRQWRLIGRPLLARSGELLQIAQIGYDEGEMSLLELLDAAEAYRDAHLRRLSMQRALWDRYLRLRHAMGLSVDVLDAGR